MKVIITRLEKKNSKMVKRKKEYGYILINKRFSLFFLCVVYLFTFKLDVLTVVGYFKFNLTGGFYGFASSLIDDCLYLFVW